MGTVKRLLALRDLVVQAPSYVFHFLFAWVFPTRILRFKAAFCPYPRVRALLLRRSGVKVGKQVEINFGDLVLGLGRTPPAVELGDRVALGPYVSFITSSYPNDSALCSHPDVQPMMQRFSPIRVEEDAWIGAGAIIFPGVTIGRGAIVGAGAVVKHDVPPHTVVAGVPARTIRVLAAADEPGAAPRDAR
jgi:maltose O-acetyltransferase